MKTTPPERLPQDTVLTSTSQGNRAVGVHNQVREMKALTDPEENSITPKIPFPGPPRPPFVGLGGLAGPFGKGGALGFSLKKREKKKFIDSEMGNSSQSPTDRLRQIDLIRLYSPLPEEREELRIPESIERLNLVEVKHILLLCGGCAFVRFTPEVSTLFLPI